MDWTDEVVSKSGGGRSKRRREESPTSTPVPETLSFSAHVLKMRQKRQENLRQQAGKEMIPIVAAEADLSPLVA